MPIKVNKLQSRTLRNHFRPYHTFFIFYSTKTYLIFRINWRSLLWYRRGLSACVCVVRYRRHFWGLPYQICRIDALHPRNWLYLRFSPPIGPQNTLHSGEMSWVTWSADPVVSPSWNTPPHSKYLPNVILLRLSRVSEFIILFEYYNVGHGTSYYTMGHGRHEELGISSANNTYHFPNF